MNRWQDPYHLIQTYSSAPAAYPKLHPKTAADIWSVQPLEAAPQDRAAASGTLRTLEAPPEDRRRHLFSQTPGSHTLKTAPSPLEPSEPWKPQPKTTVDICWARPLEATHQRLRRRLCIPQNLGSHTRRPPSTSVQSDPIDCAVGSGCLRTLEATSAERRRHLISQTLGSHMPDRCTLRTPQIDHREAFPLSRLFNQSPNLLPSDQSEPPNEGPWRNLPSSRSSHPTDSSSSGQSGPPENHPSDPSDSIPHLSQLPLPIWSPVLAHLVP